MVPSLAEIIVLAGASTVATASAALGALVSRPPSQSEPMPWWERARRTYPSRVAPVLVVFVLAQVVAVLVVFGFAVLKFRPPPPVLINVTLLSLLGPIAVAMFTAWQGSPRRWPVWYWLAGCASALLFRFGNTLIYAALAAAIYLLPHNLLNTIFILAAGAASMAFVAWGGGIWIAMALRLGRPALPRAAHAVNWAGERVGVRAAEVIELIWPRVRVDVFVFSRYLVVSDAAATLLTDEELLALCIREVTFFQQPWLTGALRVVDTAAVYFMLACTAVGAELGGHALLAGSGVGLGCALLMRPFVRKAQLKADQLASNAAMDPTSALRALERQFELNLQPVVGVSLRSRAAHLYDRMVAAGIQPAYPRPAAPSKSRVILSIAIAASASALLSIVYLIALAMLP